MISIGDFTFPLRTTILKTAVIEAKSKVRKEIHIQSMLDGPVENLQQAVEAFDRGEASLSVNPGRFYMGRRRELQVTPNLPASLSWVDLRVLTNDRYERSDALHTHSMNTTAGQAVFSLSNQGNWTAPLVVTLQPAQEITRVEIVNGEDIFVLERTVSAESVIVIDAENRQATIDGQIANPYANDTFPFLLAGSHSVTIQAQPTDTTVLCTVQFRDFWI